MVLYECKMCLFKTNIKTHLNRHLKTKKHIEREKKYEGSDEKKYIFPHKSSQILTNSSQIPQNPSQILTNPHKSSQNPHKFDEITKNKIFNCDITKNKIFNCEFCNKIFKRSDNLNRHIQKYCKLKKNDNNQESLLLQLQENKKEMEDHKAEKEKLYNYIDKLIEKTGPTINIENQTNNQLNLNNFGEEDISHITDTFKMKMLTLPYGMVQQMIEKVHFNTKKPENKNIALTNKRDKMMKVFRRKKWKYQDRDYTLDEIIRKNYNRLDEYYEEKAKKLMLDRHIKRYEIFQKKFDMQDKELIDRIKKETEMILLSDNL